MPTSPTHPRVVGVVAAVGGQVEGDRQALLAGRPGCGGRRRWTPRRWRSRRTGGSSTAGSCTSSGRARAGTARGPAMPSGTVPRLDRSVGGARRELRAQVTAERQPREALRNAHASFSLVRVRKSSASTPIAQESSTQSLGLPATITHRAPGLAQRATGLGTPLGVRRVGAGQADDRLPPYAATRSSTPAVGPATSTAMPPAASRLVANVRPGGVGGDRPSVARKTGRRRARRAAPRSRAVAADLVPSGVGPPLGQVSPRFGNSVSR
jgi:hypothetical protein